MAVKSSFSDGDDLGQLGAALCREAEQVMRDLRAGGDGWETAWRTHPVAIAYRALLREAWTRRITWPDRPSLGGIDEVER